MTHPMKILFLLGLVLAIGRLAGAVPLAGHVDSDKNPHNLSSNSVNTVKALNPGSDGTDEICIFCHTPHGADPQGALWNRRHITDVEVFPLYNSNSLAIDDIAAAQYNSTNPAKYPNGASRMCLSCHDGSTASGYGIGDVLNLPNTLNAPSIAMTVSNLNGDPNTQIDLTNSHPISFVYNQTVRDEIFALTGDTYTDPTALAPEVKMDGQSRMQCTTCHDPHNATQLDGGGLPKFWVKTSGADPYGEVCDACHFDLDYGAVAEGDHHKSGGAFRP